MAKSKIQYAFRVSTVRHAHIEIERFVLVKFTEKSVVFKYNGELRREAKTSAAHQWFPDVEQAREYLFDHVAKEIRRYQDYVNSLVHCEKTAVAGMVMDWNPEDPKSYKDRKKEIRL